MTVLTKTQTLRLIVFNFGRHTHSTVHNKITSYSGLSPQERRKAALEGNYKLQSFTFVLSTQHKQAFHFCWAVSATVINVVKANDNAVYKKPKDSFPRD